MKYIKMKKSVVIVSVNTAPVNKPNAVSCENESRTRAWSSPEIVRAETIKTAIHQDAQFEAYTFWHRRPVKLLQQRSHVCVTYIMYWTASTLPNERTYSRKWFTAVAVTRSVVTVCVGSTIPEAPGDDNEQMTAGKTVRPSFVRLRLQNQQPWNTRVVVDGV